VTTALSDVFVVLISQSPTPYYTPILNALSELVDLHVLYMGHGARPDSAAPGWADFNDPWGEPPRFEYSFFRSVAVRIGRADFHARVSFGISRALRRLHPDVVLVHSWGPLMVEPLLWARLARRHSVMWTESSAGSGLLRDPVSMFIRRRVVALADAFVATGRLATQFIIDLGADPGRVVQSCLPSALAGIIVATQPGLPPSVVGSTTRFLFIGRLVELKRPIQLAEAFIRALPSLGGATLTFVGEGPLGERIAEIAAAESRIRLLKRAEGEALAAYYREADVLVIPSERDVWGLVVNEALAAGLYVVATNQVASAVELLDQQSGLIVPVDDSDALVGALKVAAKAGRSEADRLVRIARVRDCTPQSFAADLYRAIDLTLSA
jgi:glycosyltransferase involved in cell wall biosynthesis